MPDYDNDNVLSANKLLEKKSFERYERDVIIEILKLTKFSHAQKRLVRFT